MSRRASGPGAEGGVKRKRQKFVEEDEPASLEATVHPQPWTLLQLALVKEEDSEEEVVVVVGVEGKDDDDGVGGGGGGGVTSGGVTSGGDGGRDDDDDDDEKEEPENLEAAKATAHTMLPLTLLAVIKSHFDTLVCAQLCDVQGVALSPLVCLPPLVRCSFTGAPVYGMPLTNGERLCAVGCGFKGKLVRLLSLGAGRRFEPMMMLSIVRRVAAALAAAVRDKVAKEAEELCASGQCAAALVPLLRAIDLGDLRSRALMAWLLIYGRQGVAKDIDRAFELVAAGARSGCHHCQGVMAVCLKGHGHVGYGCEPNEARSLELALESAGKGSRYGQHALGLLHSNGQAGLAVNGAQAAAFYRLAAAQGLDVAQCELGYFYSNGVGGVAQDDTEGLRLFQLAAAQGNPYALCSVAHSHWREAIRLFRRAIAGGCAYAADMLQHMRP